MHIPQSRARGKRGHNGLGEGCAMHYSKYLINIISFKLHSLIEKSVAIFILRKRKAKVGVGRGFS